MLWLSSYLGSPGELHQIFILSSLIKMLLDPECRQPLHEMLGITKCASEKHNYMIIPNKYICISCCHQRNMDLYLNFNESESW